MSIVIGFVTRVTPVTPVTGGFGVRAPLDCKSAAPARVPVTAYRIDEDRVMGSLRCGQSDLTAQGQDEKNSS